MFLSMYEGGSHFSRVLECLKSIFIYVQHKFKNGPIDFCVTLFKFEESLTDYCDIQKQQGNGL